MHTIPPHIYGQVQPLDLGLFTHHKSESRRVQPHLDLNTQTTNLITEVSAKSGTVRMEPKVSPIFSLVADSIYDRIDELRFKKWTNGELKNSSKVTGPILVQPLRRTEIPTHATLVCALGRDPGDSYRAR
jgi:hypothetical protein